MGNDCQMKKIGRNTHLLQLCTGDRSASGCAALWLRDRELHWKNKREQFTRLASEPPWTNTSWQNRQPPFVQPFCFLKIWAASKLEKMERLSSVSQLTSLTNKLHSRTLERWVSLQGTRRTQSVCNKKHWLFHWIGRLLWLQPSSTQATRWITPVNSLIMTLVPKSTTELHTFYIGSKMAIAHSAWKCVVHTSHHELVLMVSFNSW